MKNETVKEIEILNCPFCNGIAEEEAYRHTMRVRCIECLAGVNGDFLTEEDIENDDIDWKKFGQSARIKWNQRVL